MINRNYLDNNFVSIPQPFLFLYSYRNSVHYMHPSHSPWYNMEILWTQDWEALNYDFILLHDPTKSI